MTYTSSPPPIRLSRARSFREPSIVPILILSALLHLSLLDADNIFSEVGAQRAGSNSKTADADTHAIPTRVLIEVSGDMPATGLPPTPTNVARRDLASPNPPVPVRLNGQERPQVLPIATGLPLTTPSQPSNAPGLLTAVPQATMARPTAPDVPPINAIRPPTDPADGNEFLAQAPSAAPRRGAAMPSQPIAETKTLHPASAPPSARLHYKVVGIDPRVTPPREAHGQGVVNWQAENDRYELDLSAEVNFLMIPVSVLASRSVGGLNDAGLAPVRYTETSRRRSTLAVNFNRDAQSQLAGTISFSGSTNRLNLAPGAQDRLSMIFQLAALLQANTHLRQQDRVIELFVASARGDGEYWSFRVVDIKRNADLGAVRYSGAVIHLRRITHADSNDRAIDLWFAEEHNGLPVRILYTEPNTSTIDLSLQRIESRAR